MRGTDGNGESEGFGEGEVVEWVRGM